MTVQDILNWLEANGSEETRRDMLRYGIPNENAVGLAMGEMRRFAKSFGKDHALALELWDAGLYEARTVAAFLAEPEKMTAAEADAWCADFDSWAICDTVCFHLIDRTPFAWDKVHDWAPDPREFVRRAAFALIWALSTHDKAASDRTFTDTFQLMRKGATDDRPLVKKSIDMALRATGKRNTSLHRAACGFAEELGEHSDRNAQWIGRHALKELRSEKVRARLGL